MFTFVYNYVPVISLVLGTPGEEFPLPVKTALHFVALEITGPIQIPISFRASLDHMFF